MIFDLRTILYGSRQFDFTLEPDWWQGDEENDQILALDGPLRIHISISKAGTKYVLDGSYPADFGLRVIGVSISINVI